MTLLSDLRIDIADDSVSSSGVAVSSSLLDDLRLDIGDDGSLSAPVTGGPGAVTGPGTSTDNGIARFDGIDGSTIQGSPATLDDIGNIVTPGGGTFGGVLTLQNQLVLNSRIITTSGPAAVTSSDLVVLLSKAASEATAVTLPSSQTLGRMIVIKDLKGDASTNNVTIVTSGGETVDGLVGFSMTQNFQSITLMYNGSGWSII